MLKPTKLAFLLLFAGIPILPAPAEVKKNVPAAVETTERQPAVLWRDPTDIASRDLFYGPGGKQHQPHGVFTFIKEDLEESNPKFVVEDQDGVKWKVKLGEEARPETVATRLVWAAGYFTNEDYFVPLLRPAKMPARLRRGQKFMDPDGSVRNVRLKREDQKKIGTWAWREDPFSGTRELNGLRVMMALINNWDLKDVNNSIYQEADPRDQHSERVYITSDLGASFGTAGPSWPKGKARGNLHSYAHSKFLRNVTVNEIDFQTPDGPPLILFFLKPYQYFERRNLRWIGRDIPRTDVHWIGQILAKLSPSQIRDAFRAAGYTPEEVEDFAVILERRIAILHDL